MTPENISKMLDTDYIDVSKALCEFNLGKWDEIVKLVTKKRDALVSFKDAAFAKGWDLSNAKPTTLSSFTQDLNVIAENGPNEAIERLEKLRALNREVSDLILIQSIVTTQAFLAEDSDLKQLIFHPSEISYQDLLDRVDGMGGAKTLLTKIIKLFQENDSNFLYESEMSQSYSSFNNSSSFFFGYHLLKLVGQTYEFKKNAYVAASYGEFYFHFLSAYAHKLASCRGSIENGYNFVRSISLAAEYAIGDRQILGDLRQVNEY